MAVGLWDLWDSGLRVWRSCFRGVLSVAPKVSGSGFSRQGFGDQVRSM